MKEIKILSGEKTVGEEVIKFYSMDVTTVSTLCAFFGEKRLLGAEVIGRVNKAKISSLRKAAKKGTFKIDEEKYNIFHIWKEMRFSLCSLEKYTGRTSHSIAYNDKYILDVSFNGKDYLVTLYPYSPERLKAIAKFYCFENFKCEEKTEENFVCEMDASEFDDYIEGKDIDSLSVKTNVNKTALNNAREPLFDALKEKIVGTFGLDDIVEEKGYMIKCIKKPDNIYFVKDGEGKILFGAGDCDFVAKTILCA